MGLEVLGPDVNESHYKFTVNDNYAVRLGWERLKVGAGAVATIVQNRKEVQVSFDLTKRIDLRGQKKALKT
jgi:DNA polymerase-3 subunit alpha